MTSSASRSLIDSEFGKDLVRGLDAFIEQVVVRLEDENEALLSDPRQIYTVEGGYSSETQELLRRVRQKSAEAGYYAAFAPSEVGGGGLDAFANFHVWEHITSKYGPSSRLLVHAAVAHWTSGASFLLGHLRPAALEAVGRDLLNGSTVGCFGMSEPDAGSDAWSMRTTARREGTSWVLNGTKQWITNSPHADWVFVFASTDKELQAQHRGGITCFLVPTDAPGFAVDSVLRLFGDIGGNESILSLNEVVVPDEYVVGQLNDGFSVALRGVSEGRIYNSARSVGLAQWAFGRALTYAQTRRTFGQTLIEHQAIGFSLAEIAMHIYSTRLAVEDCARRIAANRPHVRELAMVKALSTEMCFDSVDRCIQICGGMGLTNELGLVDAWHEARTIKIADGSAEIMRRTIVTQLRRGNTAFDSMADG